MVLRNFRGLTKPAISIQDHQAKAYFERASASSTAAVAVFEANLRVRWSNQIFDQILASLGTDPASPPMTRFLGETGMRDKLLDVFASGQHAETSVCLPNHITRRHWKGAILACQKPKPKRIVLILHLCSPVLQFQSDTGRISWRSEHASNSGGENQAGVAGLEVWAVPPFSQIDWSEFLISELASPGGKCLKPFSIREGDRQKGLNFSFVESSS